MAVRRPLVLVSGRAQELPTGDELPGGGGSGPTTGTAEIDFGAVPTDSASLAVSVPGMTAAAVIDVFPLLGTTADNTIDAHRVAAASLRLVSLPADDGFTIEAQALFGLATGLFNVGYRYS